MIGKIKEVNGRLMVCKMGKHHMECFNLHPDDLFNYKLTEGDEVEFEMINTIVEQNGDDIWYERCARIHNIFIKY